MLLSFEYRCKLILKVEREDGLYSSPLTLQALIKNLEDILVACFSFLLLRFWISGCFYIFQFSFGCYWCFFFGALAFKPTICVIYFIQNFIKIMKLLKFYIVNY